MVDASVGLFLGALVGCAGLAMAIIGATDWFVNPIVSADGVVAARWDLPAGLAAACVTELSLAGARVNVSTAGPCAPGLVGASVPVCHPRGRPGLAVDEAGCNRLRCCRSEGCALAMIAGGSVVVAAALVAIAAAAGWPRTPRPRRERPDEEALAPLTPAKWARGQHSDVALGRR